MFLPQNTLTLPYFYPILAAWKYSKALKMHLKNTPMSTPKKLILAPDTLPILWLGDRRIMYPEALAFLKLGAGKNLSVDFEQFRNSYTTWVDDEYLIVTYEEPIMQLQFQRKPGGLWDYVK